MQGATEKLKNELENTFLYWDSKSSDISDIALITSKLCDLALTLHSNAIETPLNEPLSHIDTARKHWEANIAEEVLLLEGKARFLYDKNDLLCALSHIPAINQSERSREAQWGMIAVQLHTSNKFELQAKFKELHTSVPQIGLDEHMAENEHFLSRKMDKARKVLQIGSIRKIRKYCRKGCPGTAG